MAQTIAVTAIFLITYFFIVTERIHRTTIALAGAVAVLLLPGHMLTQEQAIEFIDFNTLGLLAGMMLIVAILKKTGVFRYMALDVARRGRGRVFLIFAGFGIVTALASAVIDNVTTVLMLVPVIYLVADLMGKSAAPFLIMEIIMSNIGGAATLIGDPPNILIGSRASLSASGGSLSFLDFLIHLGPLALLCLLVTLAYMRFAFRKTLFGSFEGERLRALEGMDARQVITDPALLKRTSAVLVLVLAAFFLQQKLDLEPATIALAGAAALLVVTRLNPEELLLEVEWGVLFFFIGLFVLVGALEKVGVINAVAGGLLGLSESPAVLAVAVLWSSAIVGSLLSAVPTVTVFIPLVQVLVNHVAGAGSLGVSYALWWALAAGAGLGGNATPIAAAANVTVIGMSRREREPLSFGAFTAVGLPVTIICLLISTAYILLRYF